ncbi:MAG: BamA/TamA family outer membrane protein [Ignavibacteriales bacterium]|nr:BamA/TamA family outer membrane protein [Ignavibacteriales bacterium]
MKYRLIIFCCIIACVWSVAYSQIPWRELEVAKIRFEGNEELRDDALIATLQMRETPSGIWKFLYKISEKLGDKPEYFDPIVFEADYIRLQAFYQDQGFFNCKIDTAIAVNLNNKSVELTFRIDEGKRSLIDTLKLLGFSDLPNDLMEEITQNPLVKVGDPFIMDRVVAERARIVNAFFNNGYVGVRVDSVLPVRYASTNNIKLSFAFTPGKRYQFGIIAIQQDSTAVGRVEDDVIRRHLDFARGDFFNESKKVDSERNLNRLGVFEASRIEAVVGSQTDSLLEVPTRVFVRSRPFQELLPEIGVNDENNAFNILMGIGYNNRNFYGGARNFSTRFRVQLQSIQDVEFKRVFGGTGLRDSSVIGNAEISAQMTQPYFLNNKTSFTPSLSVMVDKRHKYYFNPILRGSLRVLSQTATYTTASIDWNLERIGYEPIDAKTGALFLDSLSIDRRPQFNSIIAVTLQRDKRNDVFYPSAGFLHSTSIEEAGLLPAAIGGISDLPYSRYIKVSGLGQWYWDPSGQRKLIWALRLRGGFAELYGHSPAPIPINRRFFAGGSGSVRGWKARELGAVYPASEGGNALFEGNLEARWNLLKDAGRWGFIEFNKFSFVLFYDMGNVWKEVKNIRLNEVAMAAGIGIRYDTVAGPIRIDFGFRVYDPDAPIDGRWITQRKFFTETLSNFVPHFGIGHAF